MTEEQRNRFIAVLAKVGLEYAVLPDDEDEAEEAKEHNNGINELLSALASIVKSEVELACKPLAAEIKKLKSKPSQSKAEGQEDDEAKPKAKKSVSAKKRSKPAKAEGEETEAEDAEPEKKAKTKTKRVAKVKAKAKAKAITEDEGKAKQVKPYAAFTSFISTAMKCIIEDETLDPVFGKTISVKFAKRSAGVQALFENELSEPLKSLIDTEQTIETVLKAAIDVLKAVNDGVAHMMKLTPIMWSALDQTQPVLLPAIDEADAETDAEE